MEKRKNEYQNRGNRFAGQAHGKQGNRFCEKRQDQNDTFPAFGRDETRVGNGAVIGRNAVRELLRSGRAIDKLLVQSGEREGALIPLVSEAIARGIPVVENEDGTLEGVAAVIDKDYAAELLAEQLDADVLAILTEVEKVAINWGKPNQESLDHMTFAEAARYCEEGHFASGSMLPKVKAAMKFVEANPGKKAIITSLNKAIEAMNGNTGTVITFN